jgi:alpha-1,3-glucosyltransferase
MTSALTVAASLPAMVQVAREPGRLKMALFVVSLSFFFFSYHVHEKTIMFPLAVMAINIK